MSDPADSYKKALKDIRELILINGCHDTWLATQIILTIEACLPMTKREAANTEWQRLTNKGTRKNQTTEADDEV